MKEKLFVTGAAGFVGHHLAAQASEKWDVVGVGYQDEAPEEMRPSLHGYYHCDLIDTKSVENVPFTEAKAVVHLAGYSSPAESFANPQKFIADNSAMFINMCEQLVAAKSRARIVVISTGAVYDSRQPMPINESGKLAITNPYVISKLTLEHLAEYYRNRGLDCVVVRPFNHTGPGQLPGFILPDFISKVKTHLKTGEPVGVGNLKTRRDYTDVRDVANAYISLASAESLKHATYNVCSGATYSGEEILQLVAQAMGTTVDSLNVQVDQSLIRPTDIPEIRGDNTRIKQETGWQPTIPFEQTVRDSVD